MDCGSSISYGFRRFSWLAMVYCPDSKPLLAQLMSCGIRSARRCCAPTQMRCRRTFLCRRTVRSAPSATRSFRRRSASSSRRKLWWRMCRRPSNHRERVATAGDQKRACVRASTANSGQLIQHHQPPAGGRPTVPAEI